MISAFIRGYEILFEITELALVVLLISVISVDAVFSSIVVLLGLKTISLYVGDGKSNRKYAFGLGSSTFSHEQNKKIRI